ncbi:uncharacterized protein LOC115963415 [Quercus lobata]|uniref:Reverse transcriptase zinc-binding domain-containing protein n=1 Tax=Quercus lobata TaxID=97700 RepID=A0A7N2KVA6_QUELO|nr:uncharacterized protein LOC115963415 [Quercus lobata]
MDNPKLKEDGGLGKEGMFLYTTQIGFNAPHKTCRTQVLLLTNDVSDKLMWKHSSFGEYEVRSAYNILLKDEALKSPVELRPPHIPADVWQLIWKVKTPHKVNLFVWKLMQDFIPTFLTLKNRGISTRSICPICDEGEESTSHLFLHCAFARACWHGSTLPIHTSDLSNTSLQIWLSNIILSFKQMDQVRMDYLRSVFTFLWTIWNHRNMVIQDGITPNPIEVILTAHTLPCWLKEAYEKKESHDNSHRGNYSAYQNIGGPWDLIVKVAGARTKRPRRTAFAYEATDLQGIVIFWVPPVVEHLQPMQQLKKV